MEFIRREVLTTQQADKLKQMGFILSFKYSFSVDLDLYEVFVK